MKTKIWLMVIGFVLTALVIVGVTAFFYAASHVDQYRPLLEKNLTRAVGNPVRIGGIQLAWSGGVAAEARNITVTENGKAVLSVKRAAMRLNPWALLSHQLVIQSIEIVEPQLALTRAASGQVGVRGVKPAPAGTADPAETKKAPAAGAWTLLIQNIRVKDASVAVRDESVVPARATIVRHLDADIRNVSLAGPVTATAHAAVFADAQDIRLSLRASDLAKGRPVIENLELTADLSAMDPAEIAKFAPEAAAAVNGAIDGKLTVRIPRFVLDAERPDFTSEIKLDGVAAQLRTLRPRIDRLDVEGQATPQIATLKKLTLSLAGGKVDADAVVTGYLNPGAPGVPNTSAASRFNLKAADLRIEKFLPTDKKGKTILEGAVGGSFTGDGRGLDADTLLRTLNGRLVVDLPQGILLNMNLIREVLGKLSMFPGLLDSVEANLPQSYKSKLTEQSTVLKPFRHEFEVRDGVMMVRGLSVTTDFFSASLDGDLVLTGTFDGRGLIRLDSTFSNALFTGAPMIRALANAVSQIELPLIISYQSNKLKVLPDLQEISRRLFSSPGSAQQLISGFLSQTQGGAGAAAPAAQSSASAAPSSGSSANAWLGRIADLAAAAGNSGQSDSQRSGS